LARAFFFKSCGQRDVAILHGGNQAFLPLVEQEDNVSDEDAFIMSLAETIARRGHRPLEILADIVITQEMLTWT
jgi:hypothetical protein